MNIEFSEYPVNHIFTIPVDLRDVKPPDPDAQLVSCADGRCGFLRLDDPLPDGWFPAEWSFTDDDTGNMIVRRAGVPDAEPHPWDGQLVAVLRGERPRFTRTPNPPVPRGRNGRQQRAPRTRRRTPRRATAAPTSADGDAPIPDTLAADDPRRAVFDVLSDLIAKELLAAHEGGGR
jgi:hypothetical protein